MFPVSITEVVAAAREKKIAIEINNSSFTGSRDGSWDRCLAFAKEVERTGHFVVIGSDSHFSTMLGTSDKAMEIIRLAGLTKDKVLNSSVALIENHLLRK
jgi:putative hydrolase